MCSLFINDLDAGAGRMGLGTQYTVNNQMVNATLMNIADNPTNVQMPGVYKNEEIPRVPVICTGGWSGCCCCCCWSLEPVHPGRRRASGGRKVPADPVSAACALRR